jgi:hypothetical protein
VVSTDVIEVLLLRVEGLVCTVHSDNLEPSSCLLFAYRVCGGRCEGWGLSCLLDLASLARGAAAQSRLDPEEDHTPEYAQAAGWI